MSFPKSNRRCALITGGANGIGLATARKLVAENYDVIIIDRDEKNLATAAQELSQSQARVESLALDLADASAVEGAISDLLTRVEVDALVNNAGIGFARTVGNTTLEEWDLTFDVNVRAQFLLCKLIVPQMIGRGGGAIVNVSSAGALIGIKNRVAYCASKAAIIGLTRSIAADHAKQGIRANAIAPGTVDSTWIGRILADDPNPDDRRKAMSARQADGKLGTPEEVANGIAFLLSQEARFVNGSVFSMDGGFASIMAE